MPPTSEVMAQVSLAHSYPELFRVTGPLSIVLRTEDVWQRCSQFVEVDGALNHYCYFDHDDSFTSTTLKTVTASDSESEMFNVCAFKLGNFFSKTCDWPSSWSFCLFFKNWPSSWSFCFFFFKNWPSSWSFWRKRNEMGPVRAQAGYARRQVVEGGKQKTRESEQAPLAFFQSLTCARARARALSLCPGPRRIQGEGGIRVGRRAPLSDASTHMQAAPAGARRRLCIPRLPRPGLVPPEDGEHDVGPPLARRHREHPVLSASRRCYCYCCCRRLRRRACACL